MLQPPPEAVRRSLRELRERGEPVDLSELARRLLALDGPVSLPLARRIVAAALGRSEASLPDRLEARQLRAGDELGAEDIDLAAARFSVVDFETTGLSASASILEIGAVRVSGLRCGETFSTLVSPPGPVPRRIADLTGIDASELAAAPPPERALPAFRSWLSRAPGAPFVAHNASFDSRFARRAFQQNGLSPLRVPLLCTRRLARRLVPGLARYDLDHLCAHFRIRNGSRHRALGDARAAARALIELLQIALEARAVRTLADLLDLQERAPGRRRRRRSRASGG